MGQLLDLAVAQRDQGHLGRGEHAADADEEQDEGDVEDQLGAHRRMVTVPEARGVTSAIVVNSEDESAWMDPCPPQASSPTWSPSWSTPRPACCCGPTGRPTSPGSSSSAATRRRSAGPRSRLRRAATARPRPAPSGHGSRFGWEGGGPYVWAIELLAGRAGNRCAFAGSIDLRPRGPASAEVGFGLHPAARGRWVMTAALRLVRDHAFDVLGLQALRWRAVVGNWGSRRIAAAAGFGFDGTARSVLVASRRAARRLAGHDDGRRPAGGVRLAVAADADGATGSPCGRSPRPIWIGSSRPARIRRPSTG